MYNVDQNTPERIAQSADQLSVALVNLIVAVQVLDTDDEDVLDAITAAQTVLVATTNYTVPA